MQPYIQKLQDYVREHKIVFEQDCPQPCLDALWWHYWQYHKLDSDAIKKGFQALQCHLEALPVQVGDSIFTEAACLCAECERIAFIAGLCMGVQLVQEIDEGK